MAFSETQLLQLEAAAASGQLRVQLGDKVIQYQSLPDLLTAIRQARVDVANAASSTPGGRTTTRYVEFCRGY